MSQTKDIIISQNNIPLGIFWMVVTTFLFVSVTVVVRYLGTEVPTGQAAFVRFVFGTIIILPLVYRNWNGLPGRSSMLLFGARGFAHGIGFILWFYAMARIPVADVTAIGYLAPIFVTVGAVFFLKETLHFRRIAGVVVGFIGAIIIIRPGFEEVSIGQIAQVVNAPLMAASFLIAKKLTEKEEPAMIVGMLSICCTIVLLPAALLQWRPLTLEEYGFLAAAAFFATMGHYTVTKAFSYAPITLIQPIGFVQLIWAVILGMILFGEPMDPFVILGGGMVVAAASYISHREIRASRQSTTPPDVVTKL